MILLIAFICFRAQEPIFSNLNQSLINLNPSFAGSNGFIRNQAGYRNQDFRNSPSNYVTYYNSYDMYFKPTDGGLAINYFHEGLDNSFSKTDIVNVTYAQYFYLLDKQLKIVPSIQAGGLLNRLNNDAIEYLSTYAQSGSYIF